MINRLLFKFITNGKLVGDKKCVRFHCKSSIRSIAVQIDHRTKLVPHSMDVEIL